MTRFRFTIDVEVDTTRYTAKQIQEIFLEGLDEWPIDPRYEKVAPRVRGMTVRATPVTLAVTPSAWKDAQADG